MKLQSLTDIGIKRTENQDNYWSALMRVDNDEAGVICLCDGMGGLNNGGHASRIVVEAVRDYVKSSPVFEGLRDVLENVNKAVHNIGKDEQKTMGTTCTTLFCRNGKYQIYHVGDSRCYRLRGSEFLPLTTDHSALKKYNITRKDNEALYKKYKNSLTRCIGVKPDVVLDYIEGEYLEGDIFFLCSDGMWHYFDEKCFPEDGLDLSSMVKKCISSGETDNITAGVLYV